LSIKDAIVIKLYVPKLYILLLHTQKCTFPWQFDWSEQLWFGHTCLDQVQTELPILKCCGQG